MNVGRAVNRPRAVFDTNNLVNAVLVPRGAPGQAMAAWRRGEFVLVTSDELIDELAEVLSRPRIRARLQPEDATLLLEDLRELATRATPMDLTILPVRCRDPDDDIVLACAFGGNADVLVTGDEDLLVLDGDERLGALRIMRVIDFLDWLNLST